MRALGPLESGLIRGLFLLSLAATLISCFAIFSQKLALSLVRLASVGAVFGLYLIAFPYLTHNFAVLTVLPSIYAATALLMPSNSAADRELRSLVKSALLFALSVILLLSTSAGYEWIRTYELWMTSLNGFLFVNYQYHEGISANGGWILLSLCCSLGCRPKTSFRHWRRTLIAVVVAFLLQLIFNFGKHRVMSLPLDAFHIILCQLGLVPVYAAIYALVRVWDRRHAMSSESTFIDCDFAPSRPFKPKKDLLQLSSRSAFIVILLSSVLLAAMSFDLRGFTVRSAKKCRVLTLEEGYVDWKVPSFDEFGVFSGGMFGLLPTCVNMFGFEHSVKRGAITQADLESVDILLAINPQKQWTRDELNHVRAFVRRGGALLVLGDHTDIVGSLNSLNQLTSPYGIRFNFDSGYPCRQGWDECLLFLPHRINAGLRHSHETIISVGATLALNDQAFPIILGTYGFSDHGFRANRQGSYLGNYQYDAGEQLGDVVLVAAAQCEKGKVLVFGDTSPFQNGATPSTYSLFMNNIFAWLTEEYSPPVFGIGHSLFMAAVAICVFVSFCKLEKKTSAQIFASVTILSISMVIAAALYELQSAPLPWTPVAERPVALVDRSLVPDYPMTGPRPDGIGGLLMNLQRNGFLPLISHSIRSTTDAAKLQVLIRPKKTLSKSEIISLLNYVDDGGVVLLAAGYSDKEAVQPLLTELALELANVPLGPVPVAERDPKKAQFVDAWVIRAAASFPDEKVNGTVSPQFYKVLYEHKNLPIVVMVERGQGAFVVVGDGRFFDDNNVENIQMFHEGNINFIRFLIDSCFTSRIDKSP